MTPGAFIRKWSDTDLRERAGSHSHFIDLCKMLGEKAPTDADPKGEWYAFEKGAPKTGGGSGWADVWKRGCFAWEYKSPGKDLNAALKQLQYYVRSLQNPPLLIVSDMEKIELHTNWTNTVQEVHTLSLPELADARKRELLKKAFSETEVEGLKPGKTREEATKEVAEKFVQLAQNLREEGHDPEKVAHFVNRMVFCMFAEDVELLPDKLFKRMLEASVDDPDSFADNAQKLFAAMAKPGGKLDFKRIEWFNGGIFDDDAALPLTTADIKIALEAANKNWSNIDPSIMGTLFERGLDPGKRSQLGAHYTDPGKIMLIVNPVIVEPLTREWEAAKPEIADFLERSKRHHHAPTKTTLYNQGKNAYQRFIERLASFRVLDPACGSGNFLYLALKSLKDLELQVNHEAEEMGLPTALPQTGPENVHGIEINSFAAELARVSVWIGEIQWMREHGFTPTRNPVLKPLETIECSDALLSKDGSEASWPEVDVIIGNPPFLGNKRMIDVLGEDYAESLRSKFKRTLPRDVDLVMFWFDKAWRLIEAGHAQRAGLVGTNSIRSDTNREILQRIVDGGRITSAWSDEPWVVEGAAVRVSVVCFDRDDLGQVTLDGKAVPEVFADLSSGIDLSNVVQLKPNLGLGFQGTAKTGPFDIDGELAREWLRLPLNPNGRPNSHVLFPWANGTDLTRRPSGKWIIDFGTKMPENEACLFEAPFEWLKRAFDAENGRREAEGRLPLRGRRLSTLVKWWLHQWPRPELRASIASLSRYIATPRVAKHRLFVWLPRSVVPDSRLVVIAKDDDCSFGILHSKIHEQWSLRLGGWHGVGNDPQYTPSLGFETFPFPEGLTPDLPAATYAKDVRACKISEAAAELSRQREAWLNPPDLVKRVPEVVAGYPDRLLPVNADAETTLKKRTLTNLYNERPKWLDNAHRELDAAVAAAYGWAPDLSDDQILEKLFSLNQKRATATE